ncbi:MAG: OsmC family protein, partial [Candidatus Aenigmarchaeota archaeon]|nr:OsmC family protein [Candidatus Aenigmarchaeota archaeon]
TITSLTNYRAKAERDHINYIFSAKMNDNSFAFNAAEVLLSAFGDCLLTNILNISQRMHLDIEKIKLHIEDNREDNPPSITEIRYVLYFKTNEKMEKLEKLVKLSLEHGTVTNTLKNINIQGQIKIMEA